MNRENTEYRTPKNSNCRTAELQNCIDCRTTEWMQDTFRDSRVKDPDGALYNLITDPDERINLYLYPEFQGIIDDLRNLAQDWTAGKNLLID